MPIDSTTLKGSGELILFDPAKVEADAVFISESFMMSDTTCADYMDFDSAETPV